MVMIFEDEFFSSSKKRTDNFKPKRIKNLPSLFYTPPCVSKSIKLNKKLFENKNSNVQIDLKSDEIRKEEQFLRYFLNEKNQIELCKLRKASYKKLRNRF
jgi:hypothetical protein